MPRRRDELGEERREEEREKREKGGEGEGERRGRRGREEEERGGGEGELSNTAGRPVRVQLIPRRQAVCSTDFSLPSPATCDQ